jgi:GNAT superfamily N-acetyltransferase
VGVTVRAITSADVSIIASMHTQSWRDAYRGILADAYLDGPIDAERLATWTDRLHRADSHAFGAIAERGDECVGFVYAYPGHHSDWGTLIDNLHVLPAARRTGLGRLLLHTVAEATAGRLHLWVFEANQRARAFYARLGGQEMEHALKPAPDGGTYPEWRVSWDGDALRALRRR